MKKYIINIPRAKDRRQLLINNNPKLENYIFFDGVDGLDINYDTFLNDYNLKIDYNFKDPFSGRKLLKSEVGCFLSHYNIWKECVKINESIIVFEDDVIIDFDNFDEQSYLKILKDCDLLFLGYRDLAKEYNFNNFLKSKLYNDDLLLLGKCCTNTHAYCIKPYSAQKLIDFSTQNKIIPVDYFFNSTDLIRFGLKEQNSQQLSRENLESTIEGINDFVPQYSVHVLTVGTDKQKCEKLYLSCKKFNINIKNLGENVTWEGGNMSFPGGGHKLNLLKNYLKDLNPNDLVLFTDAYDVFYHAEIEEIVDRFYDFDCEILFAAENSCWPDSSLENKFPKSHTPYRYLNSGTFIGTVREISDVLKPEIQNNDDDQLFIHKQFLSGKYNIKLDYEQYLFMTYDESVTNLRGNLYNPITNCVGCIFHGNSEPGKQKFDKLFNIFIDNHKSVDIEFIKTENIEVINKDMFVIDFLTENECKKIIDIGNKHGGWNSLPDDKFPAQEIRLSELGLLDSLETHLKENVFPIIENYWKPVEMYGLRDAFIMKYSLETQTSLALHNDASLVTLSVKLNDDYKGGILEFPRQNINNKDIPIGKAIIFPGMVTHGHTCTELEDGIKYSLTIWTSRYKYDVL